MFTVKEDREIGKYLAKQILSRYKSYSDFCREYLKLEGLSGEELRGSAFINLKNRLSQILKGEKAIQTHDLPIFTELLGVSCEAILTAGEYAVPRNDRLTNYVVAFSEDPEEWERYIHREDKLILNLDEYGKSVIDYALECGNYAFLKHLVDNHYIWFVGDDERDISYNFNFGAGTSIKRRRLPDIDLMEYDFAQKTELRTKMVALAIANHDFEMLSTLKAREIPTLYLVARYAGCPKDCRKHYDAAMLDAIADADKEILDYFTEEFEIVGHRDSPYTFIFPFIGELVSLLIDKKSKYAGKILDRCIAHNENALTQLKEMVKSEEEDFLASTYLPNDMYSEKYLRQQRANARAVAVQGLQFYEADGMLHFLKSYRKDVLTTNVIYVSAVSNDAAISRKIDKANALYGQIKTFKERVENGN